MPFGDYLRSGISRELGTTRRQLCSILTVGRDLVVSRARDGKPRAYSLHVEAILARVRPLSVVSSSGVSDCSGLARHRSQLREEVSWLRGSRNHLSGERNLIPDPAKTSGNER